MHKCVCVKCGAFKDYVEVPCGNCRFEPKSNEDMARGLVLSEYYDDGQDVLGMSMEALTEASKQIRAGQPFPFKSRVYSRHLRSWKFFKSITPKMLVIDLIKLFGPPALILIAFFLLLHFTGGK